MLKICLITSIANETERRENGPPEGGPQLAGKRAPDLDAVGGLPPDPAATAEARGRAPAGDGKGEGAAEPDRTGAAEEDGAALGNQPAAVGDCAAEGARVAACQGGRSATGNTNKK